MSEDMMTKHTSEEAREYAAANELDIRFPEDNQLFVDIDGLKGQAQFDRNFDLIDLAYGVEGWTKTPSRSNLGDYSLKPDAYHYVVTLKIPVTAIERVALQAILGSDARREAHSMVRIKTNDPHPTLFFEKR